MMSSVVFWIRLAFVLLSLIGCKALATEDWTNDFAVEVDGDRNTALAIAQEHGFRIEREIPNLRLYLMSHDSVPHRSKRSTGDFETLLKNHPKVRYVQQQKILKRSRRRIVYDKQREIPLREVKDKSLYQRFPPNRLSKKNLIPNPPTFNDPFYKDQWYLHNEGQTGGLLDLDVNVLRAWKSGYTGSGVVICILDDGIDHDHPDLAANYDPEASADLNDLTDKKNDPMPNKTDPQNSHGTRCAGVAAAVANNSICGVGVAYHASIGGIRLLDGNVSDYMESQAMTYHNYHIDIYSASWGPMDDGKTMEAPGPLAMKALEIGVKEGRDGLGSIYVWATGNGGTMEDDCSADGYVSAIETCSVGSITDRGGRPYFMEMCSSTLAVVPTGGLESGSLSMDSPKVKVVTTDFNGACTEDFEGTSSAAPLAAGVLALVLQANPNLSWRDIQHIVVHGSKLTNVDNSWIVNGAGHHVSHQFGFGLMDASLMVELAQGWTTVPAQHVCHGPLMQVNRFFGQQTSATSIVISTGCSDVPSSKIDRLEHVQVHVKIGHSRRGDVQIILTSPSGTLSVMLSPRPYDDNTDGIAFTFMTVHCWDEDPRGPWHLEVIDSPPPNRNNTNSGHLFSWNLILYGTALESNEGRSIEATGKAFKPSIEKLRNMKALEHSRSDTVHVDSSSEQDGSSSDNTAKTKMTDFKQILSKSIEKESIFNKYLHSNSRNNVPKYDDLFTKNLDRMREDYVLDLQKKSLTKSLARKRTKSMARVVNELSKSLSSGENSAKHSSGDYSHQAKRVMRLIDRLREQKKSKLSTLGSEGNINYKRKRNHVDPNLVMSLLRVWYLKEQL